MLSSSIEIEYSLGKNENNASRFVVQQITRLRQNHRVHRLQHDLEVVAAKSEAEIRNIELEQEIALLKNVVLDHRIPRI